MKKSQMFLIIFDTTNSFIITIFTKREGNLSVEYKKLSNKWVFCQKDKKRIYCLIIYDLRSLYIIFRLIIIKNIKKKFLLQLYFKLIFPDYIQNICKNGGIIRFVDTNTNITLNSCNFWNNIAFLVRCTFLFLGFRKIILFLFRYIIMVNI